eukprot:3560719-Amphidinium_carterae.1
MERGASRSCRSVGALSTQTVFCVGSMAALCTAGSLARIGMLKDKSGCRRVSANLQPSGRIGTFAPLKGLLFPTTWDAFTADSCRNTPLV